MQPSVCQSVLKILAQRSAVRVPDSVYFSSLIGLIAGFGLGALNDADDDDVDIYDGGIEGMRRRTAYDGKDDDEHQRASKPKAASG